MDLNPYQPPNDESDAAAVWRPDTRQVPSYRDTNIWSVLVAFVLTYLATQISFVFVAAIYISSNMRDSDALFVLVIVGGMVTFFPILFNAFCQLVAVQYCLQMQRPLWIPYLATSLVTMVLFVGFLNLFPEALPLTKSRFYLLGVGTTELPVLLVALGANYLGVRVCLRMLSPDTASAVPLD